MTTLYILQNQLGYYLKKTTNKQSVEWVDGQEPNALFRSVHKDEALNMLVEVNSQHVELRISIKEYPAGPKNHPAIPADDLPPPLPKEAPETDQAQDTLFTTEENGQNEENHSQPLNNTEPASTVVGI